ncbi:serine protease, partial [Streptomyces sp. NPDC059447]
MAELVTICDPAGQPRGSGFVADDRGTVVTSHEAVDGLTRVLLHGPAGHSCLADVTALPGAEVALVRADGLGVRPLPVSIREAIPQGTYVRLPARGWRQARVLGADALTVDLAIGTDGRDALRMGGEARGGPVIDAETGAVLAVLSGGGAVPLRAAAATEPTLAELLDRNAATVPAYGADLNLAGALELTGTTLGSALPLEETVDRSAVAADLDAFTTADAPVLALIGHPGTGRTTALAALAARRSQGPHPSPTLWLRGADLHAQDPDLSTAVTRALEAAARIVTMPGTGGTPETVRAAQRPDAGGAVRAARAVRPPGVDGPVDEAWAAQPAGSGGSPDPARVPQSPGWTRAGEPAPAVRAAGIAEGVARAAVAAGRGLLVVLDAPEEMPPELAHRLAPWTEATAGWLRATGTRLVIAAGPEYWERAGAHYPPEVLHTPARPARRLPPALPLGDLTPAEAEAARARLGIPADAVREADARHPLTLRLLAGVRAAQVTAGRPGRDEVF